MFVYICLFVIDKYFYVVFFYLGVFGWFCMVLIYIVNNWVYGFVSLYFFFKIIKDRNLKYLVIIESI